MIPPTVDTHKTYLTPKERRSYSIVRALLAANGRGGACMEREVSDQYVRDIGAPRSGNLFILPEVIFGDDSRQLRSMSVGKASDGGYLVAQEVGPLVAYLFAQSVIFRLGAKFLGGFSSSLFLPEVSASNEAEWVGEFDAPTGTHESNFGGVNCLPHRLYAQRTVSKQLLMQTSTGEEMISSLLMGAYAAAIDRGALVGIGGVQPVGLLKDPSVTTVAFGTNGATPTLALMNQIEGTVIAAKTEMKFPGYVISPNTRSKLKATQKATGTSSFLLETVDNQDRVNGFTGHATTLLPDDGTKASGTALGSVVFSSDWSMLSVTQFGGLEVTSDPFTQAATGKVVISLNAFADVAKQRAAAFAKATDIVTT